MEYLIIDYEYLIIVRRDSVVVHEGVPYRSWTPSATWDEPVNLPEDADTVFKTLLNVDLDGDGEPDDKE